MTEVNLSLGSVEFMAEGRMYPTARSTDCSEGRRVDAAARQC
jgi:hypothetical protein